MAPGRSAWDVDGERLVGLDGGDAVWLNLDTQRSGRVLGDGDDIVGVGSNWFIADDLIVGHASGRVRRIDDVTGLDVWEVDIGASIDLLWVVSPNWIWSGGAVQGRDTGNGGEY